MVCESTNMQNPKIEDFANLVLVGASMMEELRSHDLSAVASFYFTIVTFRKCGIADLNVEEWMAILEESDNKELIESLWKVADHMRSKKL